MNNFIKQRFGNVLNFVNQLNQFQQQLGNQNPRQIVQQLLDSGQMSQQQFNQIGQTVHQVEPLILNLLKGGGNRGF